MQPPRTDTLPATDAASAPGEPPSAPPRTGPASRAADPSAGGGWDGAWEGLLSVNPLWDPRLATSGFDPLGAYTERYWLPVIGPTALLALRWANQRLREHPTGFTVATAELARCLGVGIGRGPNSPAPRALDRLCHFGLGRARPGGLAVRTHLPPVGAHQLRRLPKALRDDHAHWMLRRGGEAPAPPAA